jgi:large subunit ribosomal protein L23
MNIYTLIKKPIITEKSLEASKNNRYTFEVDFNANKNQIKTVVQSLFKVDVIAVRTVTKQSIHKATGRKRLPSSTSKTKKAIVEIKPGQTIKAFEVKA